MDTLVLNAGSSSLKFAVIQVADGKVRQPAARAVIRASIAGIGGLATLKLVQEGSPTSPLESSVINHEEALQWAFKELAVARDRGSAALSTIEAVGHRIVHGGEQFHAPVRVDAGVMTEIESLTELAPLHNPAGLAGIRAAQAALGQAVPNVAVFDTAFYHTLPPHASGYAIPQDLAARHRIRRYGFHGIAHASLVAGYAELVRKRPEDLRLITLHLGSGCSATAVSQGRAVDTSMGFTPLEGLVMGTRSGDLDPAIVPYLMRHSGMDAKEVEQMLNERAGLLGVSGMSRDMSDLLGAEGAGDARAALAIALFCYRARKYIGAYLAVLGGADAVIFGGGIGEHAASIRARICEGMDWCGLVIDKDRNEAATQVLPGGGMRISPDRVAIPAYVISADEETWIAHETVACLHASPAH
jgi:acetate kinase